MVEVIEKNRGTPGIWKTVIKSPEIKSYILRKFNFEEKRHKNIQVFKKWLLPKEKYDLDEARVL